MERTGEEDWRLVVKVEDGAQLDQAATVKTEEEVGELFPETMTRKRGENLVIVMWTDITSYHDCVGMNLGLNDRHSSPPSLILLPF